MKPRAGVQIALCLVAMVLFASCSHHKVPARSPQAAELKHYPMPPWRFYLTVSPEQIEAARYAPDSRPAEEDESGHWGRPTEGFQLSIRLQKESFTNGEPVVACVTLRNISDRVLSYVGGPSPVEKDTRLILMRANERILGADDPKPGDNFMQRLSYIRQGTTGSYPVVLPGTQRKFYRDLSKVFDLSATGWYTAQAERKVGVWDLDKTTNVVSGAVRFEVVPP